MPIRVRAAILAIQGRRIMAATGKDELIAITEKEYSKLASLIDGIGETTALQKDDDDTSIKDVIGHRAHWIELFLGWYRDGQAGKTVHFPAEGYKWNQLKAYNAMVRETQSGLGWADAKALLEERHGQLAAFMAAKSDAELYGGPMKGASNDWTPGRWAEAAGPSHYRSAGKYIRARLKAMGKA
jgi:hypothetical protein